MGFWVIAIGLTLAVGGLLLLALLRGRADDVVATAYDMQVYRDQLSEVERDLARGVVTEDEAARVRVEVSRRLLEADKATGSAKGLGRAPRDVSLAAAVVVGAVIVGAGWLYLTVGAPGYADLPLEHRIALADEQRANRPTQAAYEAELGKVFAAPIGADPEFLGLMDKLRAAVAANPNEFEGQRLLARNEAMVGNFKAAHPAQTRVIALKGDAATADDYATLADLLILAAEGYVSPEAEAALNKALQLDPRNGPARYYAGQLYAQTGRPDLAFRIWRPLLAESTPDAPWTPPILAQIEQMAQMAGIRYTPPRTAMPPVAGMPGAMPGPSADDMQAAADMTAEDRQDMIRNMVDGLAERLGTEGGTPQEWTRLVGALGVLGDTERAAAIWAEAQDVFADAPEALEMIRGAAQSAGVAE